MSLFDKDKPIELFHLTELKVLLSVFQRVSETGKRIGIERSSNDVFSVWEVTRQMAEFITANLDDPKGFPLEPTEENLIRLIDPGSCTSFLSELDTFEKMVAVPGPQDIVQRPMGGLKEDGFTAEGMLADMDLQEKITQAWTQKMEVKAAEIQFEHVYNWFLDMAEQIIAVGGALGFLTPQVESYMYEELAGFFEPESLEYDPLRINRTFVEGRYQEDLVSPLIQLGLRVLDQGYAVERDTYSWEGVFKFSLIVHFLYARFSLLSDEIQISILLSYFYRAMVVGIPVQKVLSETLYNTSNPEFYIDKCRQFFEALEKNTEIIHFETGDPIPFAALPSLRGINKENGQVDAMLVEQSLEELLKEHKLSLQQTWMQNAISIYTKLRGISLIPDNQGGQLSPALEAVNDMITLVVHVGVNDAGDEFITSYYHQENPKVPVSALLKTLKEIVDLSDKTSQSNILHLNELFKKEKLIGEDENLVVYDMTTKTFSWAM
ncbi:MAG: hypothetical protein COU32_01980 [Candidatus Magasanikbacteria bacterium CG10_big_fil_rev_8_21_14_0_10_42_10]|uniref:Uncharacterized protein n=3 Tax=Candidatus Magasanikiibacteriota TaxID=1752731 RepID=A0A2H0TWB1_9BACT|nr:MAG: hypothetical protein COU32_01980 [Candidatus Magasanikbacteria bacterium CG10_big_fil_rev_8_21_14_0_10_42_10]